MKGLFQCPPRATPWVLRRCPPAPCKGKSLEYMLLYNQFYLEFARNFPIFLQIPILFRTFAVVLLWMVGDESLAR